MKYRIKDLIDGNYRGSVFNSKEEAKAEAERLYRRGYIDHYEVVVFNIK